MAELGTALSTYIPTPAIIWQLEEPYEPEHVTETMFHFRTTAPVIALPRTQYWSSQPSAILSAPARSPLIDAVNRLKAFKTWTENWDMEGAAAPNVDAIEAAIGLVELIERKGIVPAVALNSDGDPMLMFQRGGVPGEVVVTSAHSLEYYMNYDEPLGGDVPFDGVNLPNEIASLIAA